MEPYDPISRLAMCCFGRRPRSGGFRTEAIRNQYYYSPSMAHIGPGNTTTWPMAQPFCAPAPFGPQPPQPYILFTTQPMIIAANPADPSAQVQAQMLPQMGLGNMQQQQQQQQQPQVSPLHKVPSMAASQYAIYANSMCAAPTARIYAAPQGPQFTNAATIYECPKMPNGLARNRSTYLGPIAEAPGQRRAVDMLQQQQQQQTSSQRPRGLNREIYKQLEIIEKQVDLTRDMDLVERHGLVITRAIEARSLAPHLTDETMRRYEEHFLMSDEMYVIRFIEIIKRPGQTLGLYIRLVHFETQPQATQAAKTSREGIVITKIESNSPVYTSQVLHIGDEILSINLIDIQGMSLDDVVTLMSIPKRLVLALRIPRGRDPQLRATYALNQHQARPPMDESRQYVRAQSVSQEDSEFEYAQRARAAARQQFERHVQQQEQVRLDQTAGHQMLDMTTREYQPPVVRMDDDLNSVGPQMARAELQFADGPDGEQTIMRPSDFMSISRSMQREQTNIQPSQHALPEKHLIRTGPILKSNNSNSNNNELAQDIQSQFSLANHPATDSRSQSLVGPSRLPLDHFERQTATIQSIEESPASESDRFRNFSVDNEIASLEREAMNKERQPMHTIGMGDQPISFGSNQNSTNGISDATLFEHHQPQGPSTLPRRTLPSRPGLGEQHVATDSGVVGLSSNRRPVINSIRLGETSEQSSYFSSSIDAINRELKELRRQRMALGDTDPSVGEDTARDPKPLV